MRTLAIAAASLVACRASAPAPVPVADVVPVKPVVVDAGEAKATPARARCIAAPIAPGMSWTEHVKAHFVGTDTCHAREEKKRDDVDEIDLAKRIVTLDSIDVTASEPRAHWTVVKRLNIIEAKGDDGTFAWPEGIREN